MSDVRSLEHSTLKVPYELLNKKFRFAQKTVDRDVSRVTEVVVELEKVLKQPVVTVSQMDGIVNTLLERLTSLKRKAADAVDEETISAATLKKRLDHLKVAVDPEASDESAQQWRNQRVDRFIIDYLLRAGYYETAQKLAAHDDVGYLTNSTVFFKAKEVEDALANGDTEKWTEWCYDNKSKLRRTKSPLELKIRQQEFVELIRRGQKTEAVKYARKHFSGLNADQWFGGLTSAMGLLALGADTQVSKYKQLLSADRWRQLVDEFRQENFRLFQLNNQSVFSACLQSGISSMKTPKCFSTVDDGCSSKCGCPVCCPEVKALATSLPYAHTAHSRLICAHSGEPLNEYNPPMVLPNGRVYGQNALTQLAAENDGNVICPKTKQVFSLKEAERVYVM